MDRAFAAVEASAFAPSFVRDPVRSYGDALSENALVHGENLDAMTRLARAGFAGRFRCIYLDPPFNSGRRFAEYDDALSPEAWQTMMGERLRAARALLAGDGAVFVEIDDTELGPLQVLMDEVYGREQRVSTITLVRSAATGHKAINRGPVNVTDFVLAYARERSRWRCNALVRDRASYDDAYGTWLENPTDACEAWRFAPLAAHARRVLGSLDGEGKKSLPPTRTGLGAAGDRARIERYAVDHADHVVRFAQPRYEAVSQRARALIDRSRREVERVFRLERPGRKDLLLRGGNRILFLADKVVARAGRRVIVEPLTNVWDDVPFQGIAREGGARFIRNKKPERLIARILSLSTDPGDWVLDAFLGSGTTAAVAHKMGRRWIGIERGDQLDTLCLPRLRRVVDGVDATGVTRAFAWQGGGGFHVLT
jgi:adenine-specific DNA-methyltransferase